MALTRETVVQAALRLLDKTGLDALSTRRLAQELGVAGPALYWHFKNKRELLDHVAEAMVGPGMRALDAPAAKGDWESWLTELGRGTRAGILSRRDGARVLAGCRPARGMAGISFSNMVQVLQVAGFTEKDARHAILIVGRYTLGWTMDEQAAADRPHTVDPVEGFEFGLQLLIAGLRSRLAVPDATIKAVPKRKPPPRAKRESLAANKKARRKSR